MLDGIFLLLAPNHRGRQRAGTERGLLSAAAAGFQSLTVLESNMLFAKQNDNRADVHPKKHSVPGLAAVETTQHPYFILRCLFFFFFFWLSTDFLKSGVR